MLIIFFNSGHKHWHWLLEIMNYYYYFSFVCAFMLCNHKQSREMLLRTIFVCFSLSLLLQFHSRRQRNLVIVKIVGPHAQCLCERVLGSCRSTNWLTNNFWIRKEEIIRRCTRCFHFTNQKCIDRHRDAAYAKLNRAVLDSLIRKNTKKTSSNAFNYRHRDAAKFAMHACCWWNVSSVCPLAANAIGHT